MRGNFSGDLVVIQDAQIPVGSDLADFDGVESPLVEDVKNFALASALGDEQHALLRFAEHDFVGGHAGFALRHAREINFDSGVAARSHLRARTGESGRAHILNGDHGARAHGLEAGFEQQLFHEGIADLHVGTLLLRFLAEFGGGQKRSAVDAVAAGFRAGINHGISGAAGAREKEFLAARDAERERVDQRIIRVAGLENDFAADGGNAETISVEADAANHAVKNVAVARDFFGRGVSGGGSRRDGTEAQRIEHGDGPRAHGENVAQDSANAGGRALKGFDEARMIVRLDFEDGAEAVADVHDSGIFAGALHHTLALRGKALQVHAARFIGAVLAPHHAENSELGEIRVAAEDFLDARVFLGREAVLGGDLWSDFDVGINHLRAFSGIFRRDRRCAGEKAAFTDPPNLLRLERVAVLCFQ